jgi:hypothetical protein
MRDEWGRSYFFFTRTTGILKEEQNTALAGLLWRFGGEQGS